MQIEAFYDKSTGTLTYVVYDDASKDAVVIDPVLDYELKEHGLHVRMIAETHAHADHLSGAQFVKQSHPDAEIAIGEGISGSQETFKRVFDLPEDFPTDGSQFDRLLRDGETVQVGTLSFEVIATPGHTPGCSSYRFGKHVFTGDALFMPDYGTGRCDFPGGSAADQFDSVTRRLYTLPDDTLTYVGHDYMRSRSRHRGGSASRTAPRSGGLRARASRRSCARAARALSECPGQHRCRSSARPREERDPLPEDPDQHLPAQAPADRG
jgi:glyoxylase-like metal-dependent hydrolase (beta-lactamase superfamily II)